MTQYQYLDDFRRGISVFVIFPYGIAVLGNPNVPITIVSLPLNGCAFLQKLMFPSILNK